MEKSLKSQEKSSHPRPPERSASDPAVRKPGEGKPEPKLLDRVRDAVRVRHYSIRTEKAYVAWAKRYILFHGKRRPKDMGAKEIEDYVTHLAVNRQVSSSTQNQALAALLFLYRGVLKIDLDEGRIAATVPTPGVLGNLVGFSGRLISQGAESVEQFAP